MDRFVNLDGLLGQQDNNYSTNIYVYRSNNPVMYLDPSGLLHWAWKIGIGIGVLAVAAVAVVFIATAIVMFSASAALGSALTVSIGALTTGGLAASLGFIFGGTSSLLNDEKFIDGASDGFMWGSITGVISGGGSGLLSSFTPKSAVGKLAYNMGTNALLNGSITAAQGFITNNFRWDAVYFSSMFGALGGLVDSFGYTLIKQTVISVGLTTTENGIIMLIDATASIIRRD